MDILLNSESKLLLTDIAVLQLSQTDRFNVQQVAVVIVARCFLHLQGVN